MLILYQPKPVWGLPNASPFCMKLETYLRMAEIPFDTKTADFRKAPKGKVPYIQDGAVLMGDSSLIIDYFKEKYGDRLDSHLSAKEQALALAFQRLFEEHLYFCAVYSRWLSTANWEKTKAVFLGDLPPGLKQILPPLIQKKIRRDLQGQGLGRHSPEEIYRLGIKDLNAIADFLGDNPFMLGERPCSLDAIAFAFLASILWPPTPSPMQNHGRSLDNLMAYCERMKTRYYSHLN